MKKYLVALFTIAFLTIIPISTENADLVDNSTLETKSKTDYG
ncbi:MULTISPECIES: hypothetical protein [Shouchella]|jgi:hypothetical protein|uniref:Uncharacterized protein n=1 Tax=Shouchella lehensis G1 TaxID=1246626 RepID=A0A060LXE5_9BACI|nr:MULTISPECIES: hypothetical protein [Bacillaceae]AIC94440.1 hypothetical protein BleG1_1862 [Shouchella lehensis G1]